MPTSEPLELSRVRCAPFHQELQVDPGGSAAHDDAFLCVEVPLPWERDIGMHEPFIGLAKKGPSPTGDGELRWRFQGLVPTGDTPEGFRRVIAFGSPSRAAASRTAASGVASLDRREWSVPIEDLANLCAAVVAADAETLTRFEGRRVLHERPVVDLMVCTHGRRDTCCGGLGTTVHDALAARDRSTAEVEIRVWRTSHLGGHRFAPTMLSLPDAYAWSHLDVGAALRVGLRDGAASDLVRSCRGRSTVPGGAEQVAERVGLERHGWDWLAASVQTRVVDFDRERVITTVRVDADWPDGRTSFDVEVALVDHVPQPTCGVITGPEYGVEPVWAVLAVTDSAQ